MVKFVSFIFSLFRVRQQINKLETKIDRISARHANAGVKVDEQFTELQKLEDRLLSELKKTRQTLAEVQTINRKLEETLDGCRDRLKTAEEITIPGLVAANQVFVQRWEAESRIHTMRATLADMGNQPRES